MTQSFKLREKIPKNRVSYRLGGGGGTFPNSEIDIKHTFLGGCGGMPPRKVLTNHFPEIECGGFWQLADCYQVPITCVQNQFWEGGGG